MPKDHCPAGYVTIREFAQLVGKHPMSVRSRLGKLPSHAYVRIGRCTCIRKDYADEYDRTLPERYRNSRPELL